MAAAIEAVAPGKLVLAGEYAVLAGGPGIAVAVDVKARARIVTTAGGCELAIAGQGNRHRFRWIAGSAPRWDGESPGAFGLPLEAVVEVLYARGLLKRAGDLPPCRIELDTEAFTGTDAEGNRMKRGLGSSAAVVVALTGALLRYIGGPPPDRDALLAACFEAHRRLQGGAGSGIDVATAVTGGVVGVEFAKAAGVPRVNPMAWPDGLRMVAVWTGRSASTPAMLQRFRVWQDRQGVGATSQLARLAAGAERVLAAWRTARVPALLEALAGFAEGLKVVDGQGDIGIWSEEHAALARIAEGCRVVYKPSGAGGGDFGVAFSDSAPALAAFRTKAAAAGYDSLEAGLCAPGLAVSGSAGRAPLARLPVG